MGFLRSLPLLTETLLILSFPILVKGFSLSKQFQMSISSQLNQPNANQIWQENCYFFPAEINHGLKQNKFH